MVLGLVPRTGADCGSPRRTRSVARLILDEHLTECIRAAEEGNIEVEIKELKAAG